MTLVLDKFRTLLPKTKTSPSGWISFNAPCCHHRGHAHDTRKRAGVMFSDGVVYNCFNCKYTASWQPGRPISEKLKTLCNWLGANQDDIKQLVFEALKTESIEYKPESYVEKVAFAEKSLPEHALPLVEWAKAEITPDLENQLISVYNYILNRGLDPVNGDFYWSPEDGYKDRVILPFRYEGKIVGNTARKIKAGKPKYLSDQHPHFVFNTDAQTEAHKYTFVCEGPFDALSIGGVALLTNDVADQQSRIINNIGNEVIVIPDQDKAGLNLIDKAIALDWAVAFPNWDDDIKDCADAVQRYGKLFVIIDAIKTAQKGAIKINMARKYLESKLKRLEANEETN